MSRKVFDILASGFGAIVVVVLVVAGVLALVGHNYANSSVRDQLAKQEIVFPPASAFAHPNGTEFTKSMTPSVSQYAGQQLLTGPQAEVWANDFMAVHLSEMPYHGIYSKISAAAQAAKPGSARAKQLTALEQTSFQGTTLRGMLLEAYGFWKMGEVMLWGAYAAFALAALTAVLVGLGLWHARRTPREAEMLATKPVPAVS